MRRFTGLPTLVLFGIAIENPTEEQIAFWTNVWQTYADVTGEKKPKSRKQVIAWLAKPYSDSAEYRIWGMASRYHALLFVLGASPNCRKRKGTD